MALRRDRALRPLKRQLHTLWSEDQRPEGFDLLAMPEEESPRPWGGRMSLATVQARIVSDGLHRTELCLVADHRCKRGWPGCCDECPHPRVRMHESEYHAPLTYRRNRRWNRRHGLVAKEAT